MINSSYKNNKWLVLIIGVFAQMAFAAAFAGIPVTAIYMREAYHFTLENLSFVLGCMGLGVALSEIIWGLSTDKLGDKIVLLIGLFMFGLSFFYIGFFLTPQFNAYPNYLALGTSLILAGAFGGSINSSSGRAIMLKFTDKDRGLAMSIRQTAIPLGAAVGCIVLPFIVSNFNFKFAFIFLGSFALLAFLVVLFLLENDVVLKTASKASDNYTSPLFSLMPWRICLGAVVLTMTQMSILTFASIFLHDYKHMNIYLISIIIIFIQFGGAALRIITGFISDRLKNRRNQIKYITIQPLCQLSF